MESHTIRLLRYLINRIQRKERIQAPQSFKIVEVVGEHALPERESAMIHQVSTRSLKILSPSWRMLRKPANLLTASVIFI
jgi:hypothetical protein